MPLIPGSPIGRFRLVGRLGKGGMGEVWEARDESIGRRVALKFMRHVAEEELVRFKREAAIAASLDHPNIAAIYGTGDGEGDTPPWIAMQLVEGRTAGAAKPDPRTAAAWIRDAARALQAAHERGIVHRDIKPDNLMVGGDGRVFVMDFGLARSIEVSGLTQSGMMVGTPEYMAPEQARGEAADARSDVYSLGATLYALLSGSPPFQAADLLTLAMKVVEEPAPAAPGDAELGAIVSKCLEKSPARRYETAEALAQDLERWLGGEPVEAKPVSLATRVGRRVARNRGLAVAVAAGIVAVALIAAGLLALLGRTEGRLTAAQRELVERLRRTSEARLQTALDLRRAGNLEEMVRAADDVKALRDEAVARLPESPEPHHRWGRMLRALMRYDEALEEQEAALKKSADYAPARYERMVLLGRLRQQRTREVREEEWRRIGSQLALRGEIAPGFDVAPRSEGELAAGDDRARTLGERIAADARAVQASPPGDAERLCARAWLDLVEGREADALTGFEGAVALEEAVEILGTLRLAEGRADLARAIYDRAIESDAGFIPFREGRIEALIVLAWLAINRGADVTPFARQAVADGEEAVRLAPWRAESHTRLGSVHVSLVHIARYRELPAGEHFERAVATLDRAIQGDAANAVAWMLRGLARSEWSSDPSVPDEAAARLNAQALEDFSRAIELDPDNAEGWHRRAVARAVAARRAARAEEAEPGFAAAMEDFQKALRLSPARPGIWLSRGMVQYNRAVARAGRSAEDKALLQAAIDDYSEAMARSSPSAEALSDRALARVALANVEAANGRDPEPVYGEAESDVRGALRRDAGFRDAWVLLSRILNERAQRRAQFGADPSPLLDEAAKAADRALELRQDLPDAWGARARIELARANHQRDRGRPAGELYAGALAAFDRALALKADDSGILTDRGNALLNRAETLPREARRPLYEEAIALLRRAQEDGRGDQPWLYMGSAHASLARTLPPGEEQGRAYRAAIEAYDEALRRRPDQVVTLVWRGVAHFEADPSRAGIERGLADIARALEIDPQYGLGWTARGSLQQNLARELAGKDEDPEPAQRAAVEAFDRALTLNPANATALLSRAVGRLNLAKSLVRRGGDPAELRRGAIADQEAAMRLGAGTWETWVGMAGIQRDFADVESAKGRSPAANLEAAVAAATRAIELDPAPSEAWLYRGAARSNLGLLRMQARQDPTALYEAARKDLDEAVRRSPDTPGARYARADVLNKHASWRIASGGDPRPLVADLLKDVEFVLVRQPEHGPLHLIKVQALAHRAIWLDVRGEPAEEELRAAIAAYERAIQVRPALEAQLARLITLCRGRLKK